MWRSAHPWGRRAPPLTVILFISLCFAANTAVLGKVGNEKLVAEAPAGNEIKCTPCQQQLPPPPPPPPPPAFQSLQFCTPQAPQPPRTSQPPPRAPPPPRFFYFTIPPGNSRNFYSGAGCVVVSWVVLSGSGMLALLVFW
ncbi:hypothetical protein NMG60_11028653 [Bertholletia excelsa]